MAVAAPLVIPAAEALWEAIILVGSALATAVGIGIAKSEIDKNFSASSPAAKQPCSVSAAAREVTPEDIAAESEPDPDKPKLKDGGEQRVKKGGMDEANKDFDRLKPENVEDRGDGVRTGDLPDGRKVIVRPKSAPTLEIQSDGVPQYKIRYRNG